MKFFCLLSLTAASTIPLHFNPDGVSSFVNMFMGGPAIPFRPFLGSMNVFVIPSQPVISPERLIMEGLANLEQSDISMNIPRILNESGNGLIPWIAIGPQSDLVHQFDSVDFVRGPNGARLILGSPEERFIAEHCLPNSCLRFQTRSDVDRVATEAIIMGERRDIFFDAEDFILTMNAYDFNRTFHGSLPTYGRIGVERLLTLANCEARLASLPNITISFQAGHIILTPEDYTKRLDGDICQFLVNFDSYANLRERTNVHMNPLLIPNMNMRITNQEILICELQDN